MKTKLAISVIAGLCITAPTFQAAEALNENKPVVLTTTLDVYAPCATLIGAGTISEKNGNNVTIRSDDGNSYLAEAVESYKLNDYVSHSDPKDGWVEILGHAD